jgi:hypothetical protein
MFNVRCQAIYRYLHLTTGGIYFVIACFVYLTLACHIWSVVAGRWILVIIFEASLSILISFGLRASQPADILKHEYIPTIIDTWDYAPILTFCHRYIRVCLQYFYNRMMHLNTYFYQWPLSCKCDNLTTMHNNLTMARDISVIFGLSNLMTALNKCVILVFSLSNLITLYKCYMLVYPTSTEDTTYVYMHSEHALCIVCPM